MRPSLRALAVAVALLAAACGDGGTGAAADGGEYVAALESPHGPEGAALLELSGDGMESISASSLALFQQPVAGGVRVMLVREPAGRLEFRVRVVPGARLPTARVLEVVDGDDRPRGSTEGYRVTFTRTRGDG